MKVEQVRKTRVFSGGRDTSSCLGLRQPPSKNDTTPAQSLSTSSHCCRGGDRSKVGMDFDMRELSLEAESRWTWSSHCVHILRVIGTILDEPTVLHVEWTLLDSQANSRNRISGVG